ncbi:MAG TPA: flagellin [Rhizomicrobium sp.]|nr:flagellin [Rhizomicrobium sp.]
MTIDRVATNTQSQYLLNQIMQATNAMNKSQEQVTSGKVSDDYAGIGGKTGALEAARASAARASAYQSNTQGAINQVDLQDNQLTELGSIASDLQQAITSAVGNNDATGLMSEVQSVFDQVSQVLNAKDANGNYLFGGDKDNVPPFNVTSLSQLASLSNVSDAFSNGTQTKSVMVADGQSVQIGVLASDIGTQIMQTLKDIATFNAGSDGNMTGQLTGTQSTFLSNEIPTAQSAAQGINGATAANGDVYNRLNDAADQQQALSTLYTGFVSNIEDVDMPTAITQLNQNQTALQAAMEVTAQLGQISLLNYLPNN